MDDPLPIPPSPRLTPKRKRDDLISEQRISASASASASPIRNHIRVTPIFSFQAPNHLDNVYGSLEDGSSSPRTKVAQKLRDLALVEATGVEKRESGGGVTTSASASASATNVNKNNLAFPPASSPAPDAPTAAPVDPVASTTHDIDGPQETSRNIPQTHSTTATTATMEFHGGDTMQIDDEDDGAARKRMKWADEAGPPLPHFEIPDISPGPNGESSANAAVPLQSTEHAPLAPLQDTIDPAVVKIAPRTGAVGRLQKSYPSINRLQDSKSRSRKRAGTPPVAKRKVAEQKTEEPEVIDPIRAALTWHEDEITVYDPEDKDDDRRGMDGIGFRPTPAIAYQREQMRRRQLADYRRREENEARARRNQRRREQIGSGVGSSISEMQKNHSMSRVRFSEGEPASVITT